MSDKKRKQQASNPNQHNLYNEYGPLAETIKIGLQFTVALYLLVMLALKLALFWYGYEYNSAIFYQLDSSLLAYLANNKLLVVVASTLAASASIELIYMLFTPGPDEAIEPVILGVASAALLVLSEDNPHWEDALVILAFAIALFLLLLTKKVFLSPERNEPADQFRRINRQMSTLRKRVVRIQRKCFSPVWTVLRDIALIYIPTILILYFCSSLVVSIPNTNRLSDTSKKCIKLEALETLPFELKTRFLQEGIKPCLDR